RITYYVSLSIFHFSLCIFQSPALRITYYVSLFIFQCYLVLFVLASFAARWIPLSLSVLGDAIKFAALSKIHEASFPCSS
ncbi:MAG: hypothetical protein ACE5GH_06255, partial [Fidelibacterota bacterium]